MGTIRFTPTGGSGAASIQFTRRPFDDPGGAFWFEDGTDIAHSKYPGPGGGTVLTGAPVIIGIPEPTTLALAGFASLRLLARRTGKR